MLLVDHRQREVGELDILLHQRVGADHELDRAVGQAAQGLLLLLLAVAAGEQRQAHAGGLGQRRDGGVMLAGQKLGRRHEGGLRAGLDRDQHRQQRHQGLAAADIALQQPHHALGLGHVGGDLGHREDLAGRQLERQGGKHLVLQTPVSFGGAAAQDPLMVPHQRQRELARQQLVEGEARPGRVHRREVGLVGRRMGLYQRRFPVGPAVARQVGRVLPFRQHGRALDSAAAIAFWTGRWVRPVVRP